jgi:hypothetical protein
MFRGFAATLPCGNFSAGVGKRVRNPGGGSGTAFREFQFGGAWDPYVQFFQGS